MTDRPRVFIPASARLGILATVGFLAACGMNPMGAQRYDVPELESPKAQLDFADKWAERYRSPLHREKRPETAAKAVAAYEKVVAMYPSEKFYVGRARLGIARVDDQEGRARKALKAYEDLIERYPEDDLIQVYSLDGAARLLDEKGDYDRAKLYYRQIVDRFAKHEDAIYRFAVRRAQVAYRKIRER